MKNIYALIVAYGLSLGLTGSTYAHQLSPCYRVLTFDGGAPRQESVRKLGRLCGLVLDPQERAAVHEHMTAASIREYRYGPPAAGLPSPWKWQYMVEEEWRQGERAHRSFAIIFGVWWNDDPLMLTVGQGMIFSSGGYKVWSSLKGSKSSYPGADPDCSVDADLHLARASHLGKLQHLHFMSGDPVVDPESRDRRVAFTTQKALEWMSFAYQVATGEIAPETPLSPQIQASLNLPSIAKNHCVSPANVKIRTLFAHRAQPLETRNGRTPDVALGSMLHILQDSFSPSHTCRVGRTVEGKRQALLRDVANYAFQDKHAHAALDQHPRWFLEYLDTGRRRYDNDPVHVGAWLIAAVDRKAPWNEVERHLRETVFARVPADEVSGAEPCIETVAVELS